MNLQIISDEINSCTACALHKTPGKHVPGTGNPKPDLVILGEAPGADEAEQGLPFVGRSGQLLTNMIKSIDLTRNDVFILNVVKCRPPGNRKPLPGEVLACSGFLDRQLEELMPRAILALGASAIEAICGSGLGITRRRGKWEDYRGIPVMPTFHPAFLLRTPKQKEVVWYDMQSVRKFLITGEKENGI
ncbi:MAG: uracil-DNA glycosylase [Thioploca sp.]|nr:uracil-DNA glycosylase [Thioploca sp.]